MGEQTQTNSTSAIGADDTDPAVVDAFIARWQRNEGGAERANYALFLTELCDLLGLSHPDPADASHANNDYVFERAVTFREAGDRIGHGRIDLYKRGSFLLEAKQSRNRPDRPDKTVPGQQSLFDPTAAPESRGKRGAARGWDVLMMNARRQAEDYARALPEDHEWPPFILVCDVGHCIEVYADFTGRGRNYTQFPDRQSFRVFMEDLRDPEVRERLKLIWTKPQTLDPTRKAAEATRKIAARLADVSKSLEARGLPAEDVAMFLMRCLFTMFAEDVKLLPEAAFTSLLERCRDKPENFPRMVAQLWEAMNAGGFAFGIEAIVKRFNGHLFADASALKLKQEEIGELYAAASADWRQVEPAIFGTLLEQALDPKERKRLGAHYTPRAYVERLVLATIIEPLRRDWDEVLATAERRNQAGDAAGAAQIVKEFHDTLCETRVLDPACGTGNFLYVAMELLKKLEGEVLEALADLGGQEALAGLESHTVDPHQFLGLELNPRAAAIAELVLWIGYLQWHFRTKGEAPSEPILRAFGNIQGSFDAVLTWDGYPVPTVVDGNEIFPNARMPDWPDAEFIVGNPPFIGGKDIRSRLGEAYTETLWTVHPKVNTSADYVMYWWDRAAEIMTRKKTVLRRFGLVTTNSITQVFNRRIVSRYLSGKPPISLALAIPDHPWTKATRDAAAVRIAMTVAVRGERSGVTREVETETALDTDEPVLGFEDRVGHINADLSAGANLIDLRELRANSSLATRGVQLMGQGFIISAGERDLIVAQSKPGIDAYLKPYSSGRNIVHARKELFVIDFFGESEQIVRSKFPYAYQILLERVKPERDLNRRESYRKRWWIFGEPNLTFRKLTSDLSKYIITVRTARHRVFLFEPADLIAESKIVVIGSDDAFDLGVLSSRIHMQFSLHRGGWVGVGNDHTYNHTECFDPFPFPDPPEAVRDEIRDLAEELDATRKTVQAEHPDLTLTGLYNVLEKLKSGEPLTDKDEDVRDRGRVLILKELHEKIDAATVRAYGWPEGLSDEEILERLVALNKERAGEEATGEVRWLRPDYQIPKFGTPKDKEKQIEAVLEAKAAKTAKPRYPKSDLEQSFEVFDLLATSSEPLSATEIAARFRQGKKVEKQVLAVLIALARMGRIASQDGGDTYTARRAA